MVRYISSPRQQHEEQKTKDTTMVKPEEDQEANTKTTAAVKMEEEEEEDETKETVSTVKSDKEDEAVSSSTPNRKNTNKSNKQTKKKSKSTSKKTAVKMEEEEEDEVKKESTSDGDEGDNKDDSKSPSDTKTTNATKTKVEKPKKSKVKPELQDKILAYMGQELQVNDRPEVTKQEVAEGCGYSKAGVHNFFYSWQDMQKEKKWIEKSSAKGCFRLTQLGRDNIPQGVILVAKRHDNAGKQDYYLKALCKQCKEAKEDKSSIMFDILKDGEWHNLDEFTAATGYKNLKSKGLGYAFTHMEKKMKILEKNSSETKQYRFTDKCFPDGRP